MARGPRKLPGLRFSVRMPSIAARDPLERQKSERQRQLSPRLRSNRRSQAREATVQQSLQEQFRRQFSDEIHPWWQHLSFTQRTHQHRWTILRRRLQAWLKRKPQRIGLTVALYLALCSLPLLSGLPLISLVALLPILLVPPVGFLVYWLIWQEFHA